MPRCRKTERFENEWKPISCAGVAFRIRFDQARSEPFGMSGFVSVFGNVTEPGRREVRIVDFGKRGNSGS